jgi:hypothetical protein
MAARHDLGIFTVPAMDTDLAIAGLGLGLVIGPLTSATLRVVPTVQHGIASAAVVVARMIGMLIGIASLSAWGLYRFNQHLASLPAGTGNNLTERLAAQAARVRTAYVMQYGEIFGITALVCVIGALLGLLISGRHEHAEEPAPAVEAEEPAPAVEAEEPAPAVDADESPTMLIDAPIRAFDAPTQAFDAPTQAFDAPTQAISRQEPPPGRHRAP